MARIEEQDVRVAAATRRGRPVVHIDALAVALAGDADAGSRKEHAGWSNRILDEIRRMNIISGMCSPKVPR